MAPSRVPPPFPQEAGRAVDLACSIITIIYPTAMLIDWHYLSPMDGGGGGGGEGALSPHPPMPPGARPFFRGSPRSELPSTLA